MKLPIFIWHFGPAYGGSTGLPGNDRLIPMGEAWVKTNDGMTWMSAFDSHPSAVSGLTQVANLRATYRAQEIALRPWGVVQGRSRTTRQSIAAEEGRLAAQIVRAASGGVYIVDLEPYYHGGTTPQFWRNDLGANAADARAYCDTYRLLAGDAAELWVAPDARTGHLAPVSFEAWAAHPAVTRIMPQCYWTDFGAAWTWKRTLDNAFAVLARWGVGVERVMPILPGDAAPADMEAAIRYCHASGCPGVSIWQRSNISTQTATRINNMPDLWGEQPPALPLPIPQVAAAHGYTIAAQHVAAEERWLLRRAR